MRTRIQPGRTLSRGLTTRVTARWSVSRQGGEGRSKYEGGGRGGHWQKSDRSTYGVREGRYGKPVVSRREQDDEDWDGDEELHGDLGEEDRPATIRDQKIGDVLYGVFPVLNALKAKRSVRGLIP